MRIVIVDDCMNLVELLPGCLGKGHQVVVCGDRGEAFAMLERGEVDVVVFAGESKQLYIRSAWHGDLRALSHSIEQFTDPRDTVVSLPQQRATSLPQGLTASVDALERELVFHAMDQAEGNQVRAAALLKISRGTLQYKLKRHGYSSSIHNVKKLKAA